jgi:hypothetical protein
MREAAYWRRQIKKGKLLDLIHSLLRFFNPGTPSLLSSTSIFSIVDLEMEPPFNCLYLNTKSRLYSETIQRPSCLRESRSP